MSQSDMVIADQPGASFLADLNTVIAALATNSSGATEPATTYAFQPWADTTSGILKLRNAANDGWVSVLLLSTGKVVSSGESGFLFGCQLSTAGSSTTMSISAGKAQDSTGSFTMSLSAIAKTTSAWTVGTAAGGLDTGTIANNTGYHWFVIRRPDTGVVDALCSLSATAPTLPTNYTQFRRIGWGLTNGSAQWTAFVQDGDFFQWSTPFLDVNVTNPGSSAVTRTLTLPSGVNVRALLNVQVAAGGGGDAVYVSDLATTDLSPTSTAASPLNTVITGASGTNSAQCTVRTNTSAQIRTRNNPGGATETTRMATLGWFDDRGKNA